MSSTGQQARRRDPYPWAWELPLGVGLSVLLGAALAAQGGRAVANRIAGAGWMFPARADLFTSLPAVLAGQAAAGLHSPVGPLASSAAVQVWVAVVELVWVAVVVVAVAVGLDRWGPGRLRGMASRAEAEMLLGPSRLRRQAAVIRPDLYPHGRRS